MKLKSPLSAQVEITSNCNHLCNHCYNYWRYKETGSHHYSGDRSNIKKILHKVIGAEVFHVVITGGEPLLYANELIDYVKLLNDENVTVSLNTNLSMMTKDISNKLYDSGLRSVLASLISYDKDTHHKVTNTKDTHEKILENISILSKNIYHVGVNMVVSKNNINDVYGTGKLVHSLGAKSFCATKITPSVYAGKSHLEQCLDREQTKHMLEDLLKLREDTGLNVQTLNPIPLCFTPDIGRYMGLLTKNCSAGKSSIGISSTGEVRACQHSGKSYGNILKESLEEIWQRMDGCRGQEYIPKICKDCIALKDCGAGCRESALAYNGARDSPDALVTGVFKGTLKNDKREDIDKGITLKLADHLKYRLEDEGAVIYKNPKELAVVKPDTFKLVQALIGHKFSIKSLETTVDAPLQTIISKLYSKGVIEKA